MRGRLHAWLMPELLLFPRDARQDAREVAWKSTRFRFLFWIPLFFFLTFKSCLLPDTSTLVGWQFSRLQRTAFDGLSDLVLLLLVIGLCSRLWLVPMRRNLREQLQARGVPICLKCGYNLQGQTTPRCPECGSPFDEELLGQSSSQLRRGSRISSGIR